tara:strand:+ start:5412 stop:6398 length:987 start_codon:yes stop_codon:yes gene_type:complete
MKKILVTGGCGFIGRYVVEELLKQDIWDITVVDNLSNPESKSPTEYPFSKGVRYLNLNLLDLNSCEKSIEGQEYIIHTANKIGGVGYFHKHPQEILNDNCRINSNIIDAACKLDIKRFVYLSSSMRYEKSELYPHEEEHMGKIISPKTAYGQSKLIGEWMLEAAYEENGLEYSIAVPFNAYGPGEPPKVINGKLDEGHAHVIPDLFHKVYNSKDGNVKILGEGNQIRCYTFVEDLARGVVELVLNKNAKNEAFNLATKEETSVLELLDIIWEMSGKQENLNVIPTKSFKYDVQKRVPSIEKARRILGFNPDINLYDGLKVVKEWYDSI